MLRELYVENFALIDKIRLRLSPGLTALSGETGAGKSLIIDAVALLIGGKAGDHYIREGSDKCFIEGVFAPPYPEETAALADGGLFFSPQEDLIISREYGRNGRNTCRINSRTVTLQQLKQIGRLLINIHGQMEHMSLLEEEKQLQLLDAFGGPPLLAKKTAVGQAYAVLEKRLAEARDYDNSKSANVQKILDLKYQIDEIKKAALKTGEEDELAAEKTRLLFGEKLARSSNSAYQFLASNGAACDRISQAVAAFKEVSAIDEKTAPLLDRLSEAYYNLEDIAAVIGEYSRNIEGDPARLEEIENRIFAISALKKKYGADIPRILAYFNEAEKELSALEEWDFSSAAAQDRLDEAENAYYLAAKDLSRLRNGTAAKLAQRISEELKLLYMPRASFRIDLPENAAAGHGLEKALFMIQSNVGEKFQPVAKIASGGELSRIVLAIKVVLAELEQVPTLIFDEVDSGLGGKALSAVARRMALVGQYTQSLCVTHAPLMAAAASNHLYIYKEVVNSRTVILAKELAPEERVRELARMIAGENVSETTLLQAQEMLKP